MRAQHGPTAQGFVLIPVLGREPTVPVHVGVDLECKTAVPRHDDLTVVRDLPHDAAVADRETTRVVTDRDELDPRAHANAGPDASG